MSKNNLNEFDEIGSSAIEVSILWGDSNLQISYINENKNFSLTDTIKAKKDDTSFIVGPDILGNLKEIPIVVNGKFIFSQNSIGEVEIDGAKKSFTELITENLATMSDLAIDLYEISIIPNVYYRMQVKNLEIHAKKVMQAKKIARSINKNRDLFGAAIFSSTVSLAFILIMHFFVGVEQSNLLIQDNQDERLNILRAFIQRYQERQSEQQVIVNDNIQQNATAASAAHSGPNGQMGSRQTSIRNQQRHSSRNNNETPHLTRQTARDAVINRGIFVAMGGPSGELSGGSSGIVSPFGTLTESGLNDRNTNGNLNGDSIGDSFGYNGLGTIGTGWGANGTQQDTIGVGILDTIGHSNNQNYGNDRGRRLNNRGNQGPTVRPSSPNIAGLLSPESIRRVVLRNLGQVIHCHEQGLSQNPTLQGRIVVRFVIGSDGTVMASNISESNISIPSVETCISSAVRRWQFPTPENGGIVTVNYPFTLQQSE